jgi:hypothetical protein
VTANFGRGRLSGSQSRERTHSCQPITGDGGRFGGSQSRERTY